MNLKIGHVAVSRCRCASFLGTSEQVRNVMSLRWEERVYKWIQIPTLITGAGRRSGEPRRDGEGGFASGHAVRQLTTICLRVFQPESDLAHMAH